jgi:hypothetical protein
MASNKGRAGEDQEPQEQPRQEPRRVRLPGFLIEEEIGLGQVIKRATTAVGIRPCAGCAQRAKAIDRRITFTGRRVSR